MQFWRKDSPTQIQPCLFCHQKTVEFYEVVAWCHTHMAPEKNVCGSFRRCVLVAEGVDKIKQNAQQHLSLLLVLNP